MTAFGCRLIMAILGSYRSNPELCYVCCAGMDMETVNASTYPYELILQFS